MSPGLRSRPSLSGIRAAVVRAGGEVSPGLRSRPSLSDVLRVDADLGALQVSPGLRSRPSLSGLRYARASHRYLRGVAGTTVPAFVERTGISFTRFEGSHR